MWNMVEVKMLVVKVEVKKGCRVYIIFVLFKFLKVGKSDILYIVIIKFYFKFYFFKWVGDF